MRAELEEAQSWLPTFVHTLRQLESYNYSNLEQKHDSTVIIMLCSLYVAIGFMKKDIHPKLRGSDQTIIWTEEKANKEAIKKYKKI